MCSFSFLYFLDTCLLTPPCRRRVLVLLQKLSLISTTFLEGVKDKNSLPFPFSSISSTCYSWVDSYSDVFWPLLLFMWQLREYCSSQAPNSSSTNFLHRILHIVFNVSKANFQTLISIEFFVFFWEFLKIIYLALRREILVTQPLKSFKVKNGENNRESFFVVLITFQFEDFLSKKYKITRLRIIEK